MKATILALLLLTSAAPAWAQSTLTWQWDSTEFYVQPIDSILLTATITNHTAFALQVSGGNFSFGGDLQKLYDFDWQFHIADATVPAHGTFQFNFGRLTPIGGYVQPGIYASDPALLTLTPYGWQPPENTFTLYVGIPEPSCFCLFGFGVAWLLASRKP